MAAELGLIYRVSSIFHYFLFELNLDFLYLNLLTHFLAQFDTTDKLPNFSNFFKRELKNFWDFDLGCNWKIRDTKTFKRTIFLQKKIREKTLCNFQIVSSFVANRVNHSDFGISTFGQFSNKETQAQRANFEVFHAKRRHQVKMKNSSMTFPCPCWEFTRLSPRGIFAHGIF